MITENDVAQWLAADEGYKLYTSRTWRRLRKEVLTLDNNECQRCRQRGRYTKATIVHHVKHVQDRPDLALSTYDTDADGNEVRQLISLCDRCHELEHPERLQAHQFESAEPITPERWD